MSKFGPNIILTPNEPSNRMKNVILKTIYTIAAITLIFFLYLPKNAAAQTVFPGEHESVNITYYDESTNQIKSEKFDAPVVTFDGNRHITKFLESPIDRQRELEKLPTFGLALWHHWLFTQNLFHAQKEYADCIGGIKSLQRVLGEPILIDDPTSMANPLIMAIREYIVPFNPVQNLDDEETHTLPPRKFDAIVHAGAALATMNGTVDFVDACNAGKANLENEVWLKLQKLNTCLHSKKRCR